MNRTLSQWVDYIQTLHYREIELSLERVSQVYRRMLPKGVPFKVVSVSGTNGKGSSCELISSIFACAGYEVGKYTSPHLVRFNERINIAGEAVSDSDLLQAFERVENARAAHQDGEIPLTFFEFSTLLAIDCFTHAGIELAVMEVGLGGRLDAVNILDADISAVTSISVDHTSWLGNTVEEIAVEKAGIARQGRPCILGMATPPQSLVLSCSARAAITRTRGSEYDAQLNADGASWQWKSTDGDDRLYNDLPLPFGQSGIQIDNAALAVEVVANFNEVFPVSENALRQGLSRAKILGRCQVLNNDPLIILDVAHNESSIAQLSSFVQQQNVSGRTLAVCGMLRDKDIAASLRQVSSVVSQWHLTTLGGERGASAKELSDILYNDVLENTAESVTVLDYPSVTKAYNAAFETLTADDCLLVFGSFFVAGDILKHLD